MQKGEKKSILGILVNSIDYEAASAAILAAAMEKTSYTVSALAVHGLMTGVLDKEHKYRLNSLDLVVPDGQPLRWKLNSRYNCGLKDRVYGPRLTLEICRHAEERSLPVFLYGSTQEVLNALTTALKKKFPRLEVAGTMASLFRRTSDAEKKNIVKMIQHSGARLVFVGLGCPRQEVWIYEYRQHLDMPLIAVGAAFDFHAGTLPQAPQKMQDLGLEWLFRLLHEPQRLWKRYLYFNTLYILYNLLECFAPARFDPAEARMPGQEKGFG